MDLLRQGSRTGEPLTLESSADKPTLHQARQAIIASDVVVIVLSPALLSDGRALLEIVAAYDACKKVVGIVFEEDACQKDLESRVPLDVGILEAPAYAQGRPLPPEVAPLSGDEGEPSPPRLRRASSHRHSLQHEDPQILLDLEACIEQMLRAGHNGSAAVGAMPPNDLAIPTRDREDIRTLLAAASESEGLDHVVLLKVNLTFKGLHALSAPLVKMPLLSSESDEFTSLHEPARTLTELLTNAGDQLKPPPGAVEEHEGRLKISQLLSKKAAWSRYLERVKRKARVARGHLLRSKDGNSEVSVPELSAGETHHVYLCHDSSTSAVHEIMCIVKPRLEQMFGWKLVPQPLRKPLGRAWRLVGIVKPATGREIVNAKLASALEGKLSFGVKELRDLEVRDLTMDSFVKVNDQYYDLAPAVAAPEAALKVFLAAPGKKRGEQLANAHCVLVFVSWGLFESHIALRELFTAVRKRKRLVTLMESDPARGGLTVGAARERIMEVFGLGRGDPELSADEVGDALFGVPASPDSSLGAHSSGRGTWHGPVEWHYIAPFQTVSIRRIAEVTADCYSSNAFPSNVYSRTIPIQRGH